MTKISSLTALTGAGVDDAADLLGIVDMSETGTARNKKITIDETRIALGVSSADSPQFTAINLGHASDTTITRASAGVVAIEGVNIVTTAGGVTFAADIIVPAEVYGVGWDGSNEVPTKNDVYDKIETIAGGSYTDEQAQDAVGAMVDASLTYVDATPLLQRAALTGDVTASAGSNATTIANDTVTYAKMQDVSAASKLLGRGDSGSGDPQEITLGTGLSMSGTTLNSSGGGSTAWALAGTGQTATGVYDFAVDGAKANIDFTGLGSFNELLVIGRGLTCGTTGVRQCLVSVDNGSSFYSASGDYKIVDSVGAETNGTGFNHSTNSTAARTIALHIRNLKGVEKSAHIHNSVGLTTLFIASSSDINAIRVNNSGGGNITAGTVRVYAR